LQRVALHIENPDLLDRVGTMLAGEPNRVALVTKEPDVVIADHLPIREEAPTIILEAPVNALAVLNAGASGVLPRHVTIADLLLAIDAAARGFAILPRDVLGPELPDGTLNRLPDNPNDGQRGDSLTVRELEVLQLLAEGASNKVIARRLGISFHTAKFHVASIAAKLDATGRTDAVAQAVRLGLILL
jgi:DNA-binding NarL/FixJ family response regulator